MSEPKRQIKARNKRRFWMAHHQAWTESGLSQNEYCRRQKLKISQFGYWKRKFGRETGSNTLFVPVPVPQPGYHAQPGTTDSGLTITLGSITIQLRNDFHPGTLAKATAVLGGR